MTKLTDLPEGALADLLGVRADKAGEWLRIARSISEESFPPRLEKWLDELETSAFLRRSSVEELMQLSVEDVEGLQTTGRLHRRFPYLKPERPTDDETRIRYLRDLLVDEVGFEARYPAAYEVLFRNSPAISGLPLPSFDVRILRNDPHPSIVPAGWGQNWKQAQDVGDAFSLTYRMGTEPDEVVRCLGINPYRSSPSETSDGGSGGTKHWKRSLEKKLKRGAEVEKEKYPLARTVFANRGKSRVVAKAKAAYGVYDEWSRLDPEEPAWVRSGDRISVNASTDSGLEVTKAYVQLGSCLHRGLNPYPTVPNFRI